MRSAKMLERRRKVDVSRIMVFWFDAHGANLPKVQPAAERPGFASGLSAVAPPRRECRKMWSGTMFARLTSDCGSP